jgi:hypothetical protein
MPRRLARDVYLTDEPFGEAVRLRAGTLEADLPDGAAAKVLNPAAWEDVQLEPVADHEVVEGAGEAIDPDAGVAEHVEAVAQATAGDEQPTAGGLTEPPRGGAGASTEAWSSFAAALGQVVPEGAKRDEIVEQLITAGLIEREG